MSNSPNRPTSYRDRLCFSDASASPLEQRRCTRHSTRRGIRHGSSDGVVSVAAHAGGDHLERREATGMRSARAAHARLREKSHGIADAFSGTVFGTVFGIPFAVFRIFRFPVILALVSGYPLLFAQEPRELPVPLLVPNVPAVQDVPGGQDIQEEQTPPLDTEEAIERTKKERETRIRQALETARKEKAEKTEEARSIPRLLPSLDRTTDRRLEQVRLLIEKKRFAEAVQLLGTLLEQSENTFLAPPDTEKSDPTNRTTLYKTIDALYHTLPAEGCALFAAQQDPQAKRLFALAVEQGSLERLNMLAQTCFHTPAGRDATFLLGMYQFEQGRCAAALLTFRRLVDEAVRFASSELQGVERGIERGVERYEPMLSLTMIACLLRLGRKTEAVAVAETFWRRFPDPEINHPSGRPWLPANAAEIVEDIEKTQSENLPDVANWLENVGWPLPFGTPWQSATVRASAPILEKNWTVPTSSHVQVEATTRMVRQMIGLLKDTTVIPASQPLLVRDILLLRGYDETFAVHARSGKRLWCVSEPELRVSANIPYTLSRRQNLYTPRPFVVRTMFWHDRLYNALSSDGERLFQIDGLDFFPQYNWGWGGRNLQMNVNGVQAEDVRHQVGNTLVARDVRSGKLLWQIGKFPYCQKYFDELSERVENRKQQIVDRVRQRRTARKPRPRNEGERNPEEQGGTEKDGAEPAQNKPEENPFQPTVVVTEEDKFLGGQVFLGAPLPLDGRLYAVSESGGVIRLLVIDAQSGKLLRRIPVLEPRTPIESDLPRRYYAATPAASQGIVVCPTA
ncbi:MAG TPA: hypothetical protein DEB39_00065, partial [Planctomycetaceae bacterium]|nr:hypothetical protein [Planctomycetaceae bacterium]